MICLSNMKFVYPRPLRRIDCILKICLIFHICTEACLQLTGHFIFHLFFFPLQTALSLAIRYVHNAEKNNYRKRDIENVITKPRICKIHSIYLKHLDCYNQVDQVFSKYFLKEVYLKSEERWLLESPYHTELAKFTLIF